MSKAHPPDLKRYMDKRIMLKLNGSRAVSGILRGFDPFMNAVLEKTVEEDKKMNNIGMVVVRGNSIVMVEVLDRV
ncbi:hypothetical protein KR093_000551 [Drosophila rubida]|uniref:Small nuclear ribonucleoprotein G n=1 Tax=Drosophila rubida TaxID=30044 RepID=A0AAD4K5P1_9MUSC|nr:hypothetical protein KR093_000551 [Drosophila rubida]